MLVENALKERVKLLIFVDPTQQSWWELTGFDVHLIRRELERRNTDEYEPYKCAELEYDPEHRPHYPSIPVSRVRSGI